MVVPARAAWCGVFAACVAVAACGRVAFDDAPFPTDDFGDGRVGDAWSSYEDPGSSHVEAGGVLTINLATNIDDSYAGYITYGPYSGLERDVTVRLVGAPVDQGANCYLTLVTPDDLASYGILVTSGGLAGGLSTVDNPLVPYDPAQHRWWRIRERDGTLEFAASPDGRAWTLLQSAPTPVWADQVRINLGGGTFMPSTPAAPCVFDDLNRLP